MEYEDILVNLKVLEKVQINEKLHSRGKYLNVEYVSVVPLSIRRWLRQDTRDEMLKKIKNVIQTGLNIVNGDETFKRQQILDNSIDESKKEILKKYLQNSITGLTNLKETYSHCTQTCAQIDVLIESIPQNDYDYDDYDDDD
jgi:acetate kinase